MVSGKGERQEQRQPRPCFSPDQNGKTDMEYNTCFVCLNKISPRSNTVTIEVLSIKKNRHAACGSKFDNIMAQVLGRLFGIDNMPPLPDTGGDYFTYLTPEEKQQRSGKTKLTANDVLDIREAVKEGRFIK